MYRNCVLKIKLIIFILFAINYIEHKSSLF